MKACPCIIFLILLLGFLFHNNAEGQNIRGDTIYVAVKRVVAVVFPSPPGKAIFLFKDSTETSYEVNEMGRNSLSILALKKGAENQDLEVTEGGRKHLFIISYKEGSRAQSIDLSTKGKLKERVAIVKKNVYKALNEANSLYEQAKNNKSDQALWEKVKATYSGLAKVVYPKDANVVNSRLEESSKQLQVIDIEQKYSQAIEKGGSNYRLKRYAEAREAYLQALDYKHGDILAKQGIRLTDSTEAKDYVDKGDAANMSKNFVLAKTYYQKALDIKADYPSLQDKLNQVKIVADPLIYKEEKKIGDDAMKTNDIAKARGAYDSALSVSPADTFIKAQLEKVKIEEQKIEQEAKKEAEYQDILAAAKDLADKASDVRGYDSAIKEYQRALLLIPDRKFPKKKIDKLTKIKNSVSTK